MNCRRVSSLVSAYIDGELTGFEMLEIRRHIDECRGCMLQYESLHHTKHVLSSLAYAEPREGLPERICARLDVVEVPSYQRLLNRVFVFSHDRLTPVAAGCAALGAVLVLLVSHTVKQPDIVALHQPNGYVIAAEQMLPPAPESMANFWPQPKAYHPLVPATSYQEASAPVEMTLASFGGH